MNIGLPDIFFIIVLFQLLFLSFFLFTHEKGRRVSNILLGMFFFSICLNLMDVFLLVKKVYFSSPGWALWGSNLALVFGPLLYLYTQSVLYKDFAMKGKKWLHFLPFIILFLGTEISYLLQSHEVQLSILQGIINRSISRSFLLASLLIFLQFFIYVTASLLLIRRYKKLAIEKYSDRQRTNLSWLYSTIIFFTFLMLMSALNSLSAWTSLAKYYYIAITFILLGMIVFISRVLLKALRTPELFSLIEENEPATVENIPVTAKYAGSGLAHEGKQKVLQQVQQYMETQKPFLEPELTIDQLAEMLSLKPKILSQVINELLHQNFFDFVNRFRVEEAKRLLTNPADKKITVLEVLYEVGFNSKSSFNTLFKKYTGLTPSEFKKKHMAGDPV